MVDRTLEAEALIGAVARAFYDDGAVVVVDALLRAPFLRKHTMAAQLHLSQKQLTATLQFLQEERLVQVSQGREDVEVDEHERNVAEEANAGSKKKRKRRKNRTRTTTFYYLDYTKAIDTIKLRIYLLQQQLQAHVLHLQNHLVLVCPGYSTKRCNGYFTEEEAQHCPVDGATGLFLCQECHGNYANDPEAPAIQTYTLQPEDTADELEQAIDVQRRFHAQMTAKVDLDGERLRPGIFDLLKVLSGEGAAVASNNNPTDSLEASLRARRRDLVVLATTAQARAVLRQVNPGRRSSSSRRRPLEEAALRVLHQPQPLHVRLQEQVQVVHRQQQQAEEAAAQQKKRTASLAKKATPYFLLEENSYRGDDADESRGDDNVVVNPKDNDANADANDQESREDPMDGDANENVVFDEDQAVTGESCEDRTTVYHTQMQHYAQQWQTQQPVQGGGGGSSPFSSLFRSTDSVASFLSRDSVPWTDGASPSPRIPMSPLSSFGSPFHKL